MKKAHILEETRSTNKFGGIGNQKDTTKGSKYNNVTSKSRDEARKDKRVGYSETKAGQSKQEHGDASNAGVKPPPC